MDKQELKELGKMSEKYNLREPMSIEELYQLMTERWTVEYPGKYKLKGLFGKKIKFDVYMKMVPVISVRNNVVTVRKTGKSTTVGGVDIKALKQTASALKEGGLKKVAMGAPQYFKAIRDGLRELLKDKVV